MDLSRVGADDPAIRLMGEISDRAHSDDPRVVLDPLMLTDVAALRRLVADRADRSVPADIWAVLVDHVAASVHWARRIRLGAKAGLDDLRAAVELFRSAHERLPDQVPPPLRALYSGAADIVDGTIVEHADTWSNDGLELVTKAALGRTSGTLEQGITLLRKSVDISFDGHPAHGRRLINLCAGLLTRYQATDEAASLADAVEAARKAVAVTSPESPYHGDCLYGLGFALSLVADATGEERDHDEAIAVLTTAAAALSGGHPKQSDCLRQLGVRIGFRAALRQDTAGLEQAVEVLRRAIAVTDESTAQHLNALERLAVVTQLLCQRTGSRQHAADGIAVCRRAVALAPAGHPDRARLLTYLSSACRQLFELTGTPAMIEEAATVARAAVAESPSADLRTSALGELGTALTLWHRQAGDIRRLDEAVAALRTATAVKPTEVLRSHLASALLDRYLATGDTTALNESITSARQAIADTTPDDPLRPLRKNLLGRMLWHRGDQAGDREALAEAITVLREAAAETPADHMLQLSIHTNLGAAYAVGHHVTGAPDALDAAVAAHQRVVDQVPADHPKRGLYLGNLGASRYAKYRATRTTDALDAAIESMLNAVADTPAHHLPAVLSNLASMALDRHERTGTTADLELAVSSARRAVDLLPDDHPWRCAALTTLGQAHQAGGRIDEGLRELRQAAEQESAPVATRIDAARLWGDTAHGAGRLDTALVAYSTAVELLPLLSGRELRQADQEQHLARHHGVVGDAAACAVTLGRPERAVELLEAGRAILATQVLENRNDLGELHVRAPELAARLAALREELATIGDSANVALDEQVPRLDRRHELGREWANLVATVRAEHGGAGLNRAPSIEDLLPAAAHGPVVIVNVSRHRCDALVVTTTGVRTIPLPELTFTALVERTAEFVTAVDDAFGHPSADERAAAEQIVSATIDWLGRTVTGPVLASTPADRVWWSPTSALTFLPLHAAAIDRVVSSYAPTIGALTRARERRVRTEQGLVVALPNTPGLARLPGVTQECDLLTELFPDTKVLRGASATRQAVLRELGSSSWVHLACHGSNEIDMPSLSNLRLWDGPLAVRDLLGLAADRGALAFLAACETAQGGSLLTDEALHIGGAFHLAGYAHVIATLWAAHDGVSVALTESFYRRLRGMEPTGPDPTDSAAALHAAVLRLRDEHPGRPSRWAPYLHFGP
jgi:tetratricopeptide (TPR) repeat protein